MDQLPTLAGELVRRQVAVIVAAAQLPAFAAKAATRTIPVVFIVSDDPVKLGLVASLARPDGNLTGVNFLNAELTAKRLELLRELVPGAVRVAALVNPANPNAATTAGDVKAAAGAMGLDIQILHASTVGEIDSAFATIGRERPAALFVATDPLFRARRAQLAQLAAHHMVPATRSGRAGSLRGVCTGAAAIGLAAVTYGSTSARPQAMSTMLANTRRNWSHSRPAGRGAGLRKRYPIRYPVSRNIAIYG
jgi:putative ABC transport system substrate-binding protein